jgi:large subunit ribosomal protein L21
MFAVIKTGGKQYRVAADDLLKVDRIAANTGDIVEFNTVLAVGEGDTATLGAPLVEGALVTAEVVSQDKSRTVIAFKKRRRQNSRRSRGQRQLLTTVRIAEILTGGAKPARKSAAKPPATPQAEVAPGAVEAEPPAEAAASSAQSAPPTAAEAPAAKKPARKAAPKKAAPEAEKE